MFPAQKAIGFYQRPIPARSSANQFVIPLVEMAGNVLAPTPAYVTGTTQADCVKDSAALLRCPLFSMGLSSTGLFLNMK